MSETVSVSSILSTGKANARTAKYLANILGINQRSVTEAIRKERINGVPICADCMNNEKGYYLPENADELNAYINRLDKRIDAISEISVALKRVKM